MIGGGPAGSAAAATLARAGQSVLLVVDADRHRPFAVGEGAPPGLERAVDEVFGAGTFVAADHVPSYANRAAWGGDRLTTAELALNPFGSGWHLDRLAFDRRLRATAEAAGATIGVEPTEAPVVIDASGRRAMFARRHGARLVTHDRLTAVVAVFPPRADDADTSTTVEATMDGWWYTAAIPAQRRVVAFLTDGDLLRPEHRSAEGFAGHVAETAHIGPLVEGRPDHLVVVAAGSAHLDRPIGAGWIAAGDAAASFDPLSSQGLLTAVLMGRAAAEAAIDPPRAADFERRYRAIVDDHQAQQRATYALEQRWPDAPFWRRRTRE